MRTLLRITALVVLVAAVLIDLTFMVLAAVSETQFMSIQVALALPIGASLVAVSLQFLSELPWAVPVRIVPSDE